MICFRIFYFIFVYLTFIGKQIGKFSQSEIIGGRSRVHSANTFWKISRQYYFDDSICYVPTTFIYFYNIYYYEISNTFFCY